jgi:hypothetical protein
MNASGMTIMMSHVLDHDGELPAVDGCMLLCCMYSSSQQHLAATVIHHLS